MQYLKRNSYCHSFGKRPKKREKNISNPKAKLPWVDEVRDQVRFQLTGQERQPVKPISSYERHARAINATSWCPKDLCRQPCPRTAGPGPTFTNRLMCKLYALPLHECVHRVTKHTDETEGRKVCHIDQNSCCITRAHRTTESYEIIISISFVIIL